jgi:hypothetical protein
MKLDKVVCQTAPSMLCSSYLSSHCHTSNLQLIPHRSFVFGGFDGAVASLAILSGAAGGDLSWHSVLILGLSSIVANSISLGISEFLSSKAHREFLKAEKRRELWEFKNYRDVEILQV